MNDRDVLIPAAVMALLRGDDSVRGVADRLGVTEAHVLELRDVFIVAGVLAITEYRRGRLRAYAGNPIASAATTSWESPWAMEAQAPREAEAEAMYTTNPYS